MLNERRKIMRRQSDRELRIQLEARQKRRADDASTGHGHLRRRAIRHNCKVRIALSVRTSFGGLDAWTHSEHPVPGRILDLSPDGCSLFSSEQMDIGARLALGIELPEAAVIQCAAVIRWTKAVPERSGYASGVQFVELSEENRKRINAFIQKIDATIGL